MQKTYKRLSRVLRVDPVALSAICSKIEARDTITVEYVECIEQIGIPVWRELCEAFNCDMEEAQELALLGKISACDVKDALKRFSSLFV